MAKIYPSHSVCVCVYIYIYLYIYIYIYIYIFPSLALVSSWLSGRILDWHLSQPGFDPSFRNLACLATLKSSDGMKQIYLWMTIYIYIYILSFTNRLCLLYHNTLVCLDTLDTSSWDWNPPNFYVRPITYCSAISNLTSAQKFDAFYINFC